MKIFYITFLFLLSGCSSIDSIHISRSDTASASVDLEPMQFPTSHRISESSMVRQNFQDKYLQRQQMRNQLRRSSNISRVRSRN